MGLKQEVSDRLVTEGLLESSDRPIFIREATDTEARRLKRLLDELDICNRNPLAFDDKGRNEPAEQIRRNIRTVIDDILP